MTASEALTPWIPGDDTFGARLALIRQRMGWGNTKEAALACGLPVQSWRGWERDGRQPRDYMGTCQAIADATGVNVYWLLGVRDPSAATAGADSAPAVVQLPRLDSNQQPSG